MRQLWCQAACLAGFVFGVLLGSCGGGPPRPQPGDEFVDQVYRLPEEGACFSSRDAVGTAVRAARGFDVEALQAMNADGRVWILSSGTPLQVAQVIDDIAAVYPLRGRYVEKRCYLPLATIEKLAGKSKPVDQK